MSDAQTPKVKLDWSRLLGFDQAPPPGADAGTVRAGNSRLVKLGSKIGTKKGLRSPV
jgi:hypothetical protein